MSISEESATEAQSLSASLEVVSRALRLPEESGLSAAQLQAILADVVRAYARIRENDGNFAAFPADTDVSATEVAIATSGILEAADMAAFELGMWQTLKR